MNFSHEERLEVGIVQGVVSGGGGFTVMGIIKSEVVRWSFLPNLLESEGKIQMTTQIEQKMELADFPSLLAANKILQFGFGRM